MVPTSPDVLRFFPAGFAAGQGERPFVVIVRTAEELRRWLDDTSQALQRIELEGLLHDPDAWATAAQSATNTPLDVVLSHPSAEFANLYRLVDVRASRQVRVTMLASSGFMKALRLAVSLGLPARLLPGQPSPEIIEELSEALDVYLHDPMIDAPIEPFHSLLAGMHGVETVTLWEIQEEDPAGFVRYDDSGHPVLLHSMQPAPDETSVAQCIEQHIASIVEQRGECASCPWWKTCAGYFKWPDRMYSCSGVKQLFACIAEASSEFARDLAVYESSGRPRSDKV